MDDVLREAAKLLRADPARLAGFLTQFALPSKCNHENVKVLAGEVKWCIECGATRERRGSEANARWLAPTHLTLRECTNHCWHPFTASDASFCCRPGCKDIFVGEHEEKTHGLYIRPSVHRPLCQVVLYPSEEGIDPRCLQPKPCPSHQPKAHMLASHDPLSLHRPQCPKCGRLDGPGGAWLSDGRLAYGTGRWPCECGYEFPREVTR